MSMAQLLTWSEVDSNLQSSMSNRCPSEDTRLEAINNEVRNINTVYDVETAIRSVSISIIPNGTVYKISSLVDDTPVNVLSDDDLKKIADIYQDDDDSGIQYEWLDKDEFFRNIRSGYKEDSYTTYFKNGDMYLAVNSSGGEAVATDYTMDYYSTFLALDGSGNFKTAILADSNYKILLPARFKDLVVSGSKMRLFWPSIGEDGNNQYSIESNKYKSELKKLGLDDTVQPIKKKIRKVKLRSPLY